MSTRQNCTNRTELLSVLISLNQKTNNNNPPPPTPTHKHTQPPPPTHTKTPPHTHRHKLKKLKTKNKNNNKKLERKKKRGGGGGGGGGGGMTRRKYSKELSSGWQHHPERSVVRPVETESRINNPSLSILSSLPRSCINTTHHPHPHPTPSSDRSVIRVWVGNGYKIFPTQISQPSQHHQQAVEAGRSSALSRSVAAC